MKFALLILLCCSTAHAADPIYKFRMYESQAVPVISNLRKSQLHKDPASPYSKMEFFLVYSHDRAKMTERIQQFREIGCHAVPGIILAPTTEADWMDKGYWQRKANELLAVCQDRVDGDRRVSIDCENYGKGAEAREKTIETLGGRAKFIEASKPFMEVLTSQQVIPCMYPAWPDNVFMQEACKAVSRSELWSEYTYDLAHRVRIGQKDNLLVNLMPPVMRNRSELLAIHPGAHYVPGFWDEAVRKPNADWEKNFRPMFGERDCWLYLKSREIETLIGTAEWLEKQ